MKKFMDAGISGEVAALYMCQISENSNSDDVDGKISGTADRYSCPMSRKDFLRI